MQPDDTALIERARSHVGRIVLSKDDLDAGTVAAALRTRSGAVHTGICIDLACGIGSCAEHAAVAEMLKSGETLIGTIVAVSATRVLPPCGRCRELMLQIDSRNAAARVVIAPDRVVPLAELAPHHWLIPRPAPAA